MPRIDEAAGDRAAGGVGVLRDRLDQRAGAERRVGEAAPPLVDVPAEVDEPGRRARQPVDLLDLALSDVADPEIARRAVEAVPPRVAQTDRDELGRRASPVARRAGTSSRAGCRGSARGSRDRRPSRRRRGRPRASRRARTRDCRRCGSRTAARPGGSPARSSAAHGRSPRGSGRPASTRRHAPCSSRRRFGRARSGARTRARAAPARRRRRRASGRRGTSRGCAAALHDPDASRLLDDVQAVRLARRLDDVDGAREPRATTTASLGVAVPAAHAAVTAVAATSDHQSERDPTHRRLSVSVGQPSRLRRGVKIIVVGAGQVGSTIVEALHAEHDLTVIDTVRERLEPLAYRYDIVTIEANGASRRAIQQAGTSGADLFIACTSRDEVNLVACSFARAEAPRRHDRDPNVERRVHRPLARGSTRRRLRRLVRARDRPRGRALDRDALRAADRRLRRRSGGDRRVRGPRGRRYGTSSAGRSARRGSRRTPASSR